MQYSTYNFLQRLRAFGFKGSLSHYSKLGRTIWPFLVSIVFLRSTSMEFTTLEVQKTVSSHKALIEVILNLSKSQNVPALEIRIRNWVKYDLSTLSLYQEVYRPLHCM